VRRDKCLKDLKDLGFGVTKWNRVRRCVTKGQNVCGREKRRRDYQGGVEYRTRTSALVAGREIDCESVEVE
jgi:hypothetical protein